MTAHCPLNSLVQLSPDSIMQHPKLSILCFVMHFSEINVLHLSHHRSLMFIIKSSTDTLKYIIVSIYDVLISHYIRRLFLQTGGNQTDYKIIKQVHSQQLRGEEAESNEGLSIFLKFATRVLILM